MWTALDLKSSKFNLRGRASLEERVRKYRRGGATETDVYCVGKGGDSYCLCWRKYEASSKFLEYFRRVCKIAKSDHLLRHVFPPALNNSAPTGRIFMKFDTWVFFGKKKLPIRFTFDWNQTRITGTLYEDQYTFLIISCWSLLRMSNISHKICRKYKNFVFNSVFFPRKSCRLWDKVEKILYSGAGHRRQYGACALHAGYLRLHTHTQNM